MRQVAVHGDHITLGQLLKLAGAVGTGGEAKRYLAERPVRVNEELENRRGRKLRPGDTILLEGIGVVRLVGPDGARDVQGGRSDGGDRR